jgi:hypothetical protein
MSTLDEDISEAASMIGLLLVFVVGYFSGFAPIADELMDRAIPEEKRDHLRFAARLRSMRNTLGGLVILLVAVFALIAPLGWRVLESLTTETFTVSRGGVLLILVLLLAMFGAAMVLIGRLKSRRCEVLQRAGSKG